ncbi:Cytochrome C biogenesis protein transmembrane region [Nocardioides dokdonensis FR1436]|uniref:Cytochrome C biogenesis protein transmembrane region n=1 Tax=Nocardioides dokdonensis FR1436 TaxID=1300347 RepID=A0A1A9GRX4_9ACTN|nr:cytochrome c biogenesis CcdA family protein [Nocardioides dokdonensis]ANH40403.1 Cytochrome C biogenesis protein transmembrane region [Nocardioides dokdonensis FR1436]
MSEGLVAVALGAGMLAAVNPCGFALLPAYVSLLVAGDDSPDRRRAVLRALALTGAMTLGFSGVFLAFGLAVAPVVSQVQRHLPWVTVGLGLLLVLLGGWLLAGRRLAVPRLPRRGAPRQARPLQRSFWSMTGFGAGYAVASLSCTIAPFLAVVVVGFRSDSVLEGAVLFLAYAAGMGSVVGALAVATALASPTTVQRLRRTGAWASRVAGLVLVAAGSYVAYYGWWELRILAGADAADDPVILAAASVQRALVDVATAVGPGGWALLVAALVALTLVAGRLRARTRSSSDADVDRPGPAVDTSDREATR